MRIRRAFLVLVLVMTWPADAAINPPFVEAVHIDLHSLRPLSFTTVGRPALSQD
jgi:hypothetical protein